MLGDRRTLAAVTASASRVDSPCLHRAKASHRSGVLLSIATCLLCAVVTRGQDAASKEQMTEKRFEQECNRFVSGVLLGIFDEAHPVRSQRDDAARGAIVASIARYTDTFGTQPPAGESLNSSSQLIDAGYTDPILLLMNGYLLRTNGMEVEAIQRLQAVNQEQLKGPHGALARAVCLEQLAMANRKRNAKAEKEFERLAAESTLTAVRGGFVPGGFAHSGVVAPR
jgi:hypothetical protein